VLGSPVLHTRKAILSPPSLTADFVRLDVSGVSYEAVVPTPHSDRFQRNPHLPHPNVSKRAQFDELRTGAGQVGSGGAEHVLRRMHSFTEESGPAHLTQTSTAHHVLPAAHSHVPASPARKPLKSALKRSLAPLHGDTHSVESMHSGPSREASKDGAGEDVRVSLLGSVTDQLPARMPLKSSLRNGQSGPTEQSHGSDDDEVRRAKEEVRRLRELLAAVDVKHDEAADDNGSNPQDASALDDHESKGRKGRSSSRSRGDTADKGKSKKKKSKKNKKSRGGSPKGDEEGEENKPEDVEISSFHFPEVGEIVLLLPYECLPCLHDVLALLRGLRAVPRYRGDDHPCVMLQSASLLKHLPSACTLPTIEII
jgi:hypothetical protein